MTSTDLNLLTVSGPISGAGNLTINANTNGGVTLSNASINPAGSITTSGSGTNTVTISGVIGAAVTRVNENSPSASLTLSGNNSNFSGGVTVKAGTLTLSTSANAPGTGTLTLGDTASNPGNVVVTIPTNALTFANPIVLNSGTTGTITMTSSGTTSTTFSGGITGTHNLIIVNGGGTGTYTFSTNPANFTGSITVNQTGITNTGTVTFSGGIGANVTTVTNNSNTNPVVLSTIDATGGFTLSSTSTLNTSANPAIKITGNVTSTASNSNLTILANGDGATSLNTDSANPNIIFTANINSQGKIINSGTGHNAVVVTTIGSNVTGAVENSTTSILYIAGAFVVTPSADLAVSNDDTLSTLAPGGTAIYTVIVSNNGPSDVVGATVTDNQPASMTYTTWSVGGQTSGASATLGTGAGNLNDTVNLAAGASIT